MINRVKRIPELDAIRGGAALGVVLFHAYPRTFFLGWSLVDCFFVLSGYLITTIILQYREVPQFLLAFYIRRALRIWPVYYLTLAAVVALNALSRRGYPTDGLPQNLTFTQNIQGYWQGEVPEFIPGFAASWSVAVEEQFYLFWPVLLLTLGARSVPRLAISLLALALAARASGYPLYLLLTRADGLAFGSLLASLLFDSDWMQANLTKLKRAFMITGLLSLGYVSALAYSCWGDPAFSWVTPTFFAFGLLYFSFIGLVICYSGHPLLRPLRSRSLRYLGLISYSLYLFHQPLFSYLPRILEEIGVSSHWLIIICVWSAIFAVPSLSYYLIERPILNLKERVDYGQAPADTLPPERVTPDQGSKPLTAPVSGQE